MVYNFGSNFFFIDLCEVKNSRGWLALLIIIGLQYLLAYFAKSSKKAENFIISSPTLLFYNGIFLTDAMEKELITEKEIYAEIRKYRIESISDVSAVVIASNGEISVIKKEIGR